jgi:hypothetical protein
MEKRKPGWPKGKPRKPREKVTDLTGGNGNVSSTSENDEKARRNDVWPDKSPRLEPDIALTTYKPTFSSDFDITTLGTRTETRMVEKAVVVGKTDLGKDVITIKMRPETVTKIQSILNLEEALSLGKRDWQPFPPYDGHWFCRVEQKDQHRRFLIRKDVYEKVKDA